ncbi:MAG: phosphoribosylamine--glycine ligase [Phycisphaerales bacterium]|nr:phosphoribosylamine--glycine ligase [Phycisphaerales bacterium]
MPANPRPTMPERVNVLLIGGGGREHALARQIKQSSRLGRLWVDSTANAAILAIGTPCTEPISKPAMFRLNSWCDKEEIGLVVIGPEAPLADGWADDLATENRLVFGPSKAAARIEADKGWAKEIMRSASVPSAEGRTFKDRAPAIAYAMSREEGCVVKASGLAAGKGVFVCPTPEEAVAAVQMMMGDPERRTQGCFGAAGDTIVIEELLQGQEMSVLAFVDGRSIWVLDPCQDHKQVGEGDVGPNTGGMGAYCPTPLATPELMSRIERDILVPTIDGLRREGIIFRGVLYAGLMLTAGGPKVLEYNCRFGDPECQPLMARLQGDLLEVLWATAAGQLDELESGLEFDPRTACCVVLCSAGYPGSITKGHPITGIEAAEAEAGPGEAVIVFHSGTTVDSRDRVVSAGGRVISVTALAADLTSAQDLANRAAAKIEFAGAFFRRDIGSRVMNSIS